MDKCESVIFWGLIFWWNKGIIEIGPFFFLSSLLYLNIFNYVCIIKRNVSTSSFYASLFTSKKSLSQSFNLFPSCMKNIFHKKNKIFRKNCLNIYTFPPSPIPRPPFKPLGPGMGIAVISYGSHGAREGRGFISLLSSNLRSTLLTHPQVPPPH